MLDFTTIFIYSTAITLFIAVVTGAAWYRSEERLETYYWFVSSILQLAGPTLLSLGPHIPYHLGSYSGAVAEIAATGFLALGYRKLYGHRVRASRAIIFALTAGTCIYLTRFITEGTYHALYLIYLCSSINLAIAAHAVWRGLASEPLPSGRMAAWVLTGYAVADATVVPLAFFYPVHFVGGQPISDWLQIVAIPMVMLNLAAYMMTLVLKLERATERQRLLATHDSLTGILNRRAFREQAAESQHRDGVLAIMDLDHFKKINDVHGHHAGDEALRLFSATISDRLPGNALFGRLGGEEFAIFLPHFGKAEAYDLLRELCRRVAALNIRSRSGMVFSFTVSCGFTTFDDRTAGPDQIFGEADCALYSAKNSGRNRVLEFDPVMIAEREARHLRTLVEKSAATLRATA